MIKSLARLFSRPENLVAELPDVETSGPRTGSAESLEFEHIDRHSRTWMRTKAHLEARIHQLHLMCEQAMDERKTAELRGRIAENRRLIAKAEPTETNVKGLVRNY